MTWVFSVPAGWLRRPFPVLYVPKGPGAGHDLVLLRLLGDYAVRSPVLYVTRGPNAIKILVLSEWFSVLFCRLVHVTAVPDPRSPLTGSFP